MTIRPQAQNCIYFGVAGTGKTHQLLTLAKNYTDEFAALSIDELCSQLVAPLNWREVICLIFLDFKENHQELVKVPELLEHRFFMAKAAQNFRDKNLSATAWSVLQQFSHTESTTVRYKNRAAQAYFDKDINGAWYLLADIDIQLVPLNEQLSEFHQACRQNNAQANRFERFSMVSFHQAYGYEEFVEGIRPVVGSEGAIGSQTSQSMSYAIRDGAFLALCQRAARDPNRRYAMLIDEINRANVSRVFGELLSLIEPDKRLGMPNAMTVSLAYSGRQFGIPSNVDIFATMNTQDVSLAPLDLAFRRRFRFIDCPPTPELLPVIQLNNDNDINDETIDMAKILVGLNQRIIEVLGMEARLGHAFLMTVSNIAELQSTLVQQIIPQLAQLANQQLDILQYIFNDPQQAIDAQFIQAPPHLRQGHFEQAPQFSANQLFGQFNHGATGFIINPKLISGSDPFTTAAIYQRLYDKSS
ncbi:MULTISPECIES: McrB family protein [Psychrobacter]|uniref:McrB family protein n=1 Tax=Psychrobacter TaxID=497 RepID=UPI00146E9841|nr:MULTISPECIES: AAA family ATPase [Psychrobacter]